MTPSSGLNNVAHGGLVYQHQWPVRHLALASCNRSVDRQRQRLKPCGAGQGSRRHVHQHHHGFLQHLFRHRGLYAPLTVLNMPRDLLADKTLESMPQLSREPAAASPQPAQRKANPYGTSLVRVEDPFKKIAKNKIHPFSSLLSIDDLDDCDWLEHAAFDAIEAASREKVSKYYQVPANFTYSATYWLPALCRL